MALTTNLQQASPPHSVTVQGAYEPFELQVSRGQIMGHERICPFGYNGAVTAQESLWAEGGLYTFPTGASLLTVVSSSANDDGNLPGTGARTVVIEGLDENYERISETVILDGTAYVSTINSYLRVNNVYVATVGSVGTSVGKITVENLTPTTLATIVATLGNSEQCIYTVPAGYTAYITRYALSSYNATTGAGTFGQIYIRPFGGANQLATTVRIPGTGAFTCEADYPFPVTEKSDIDFRSTVSAGSANVSAQLQMVLIKNDSQTA
jgi:hypothetical protein